ncbi:MAG: hypothetical protein JNN20_10880 [Betaproteobacteria bacterium]|nr:hypothetical protein [Betaproteobacteria bacterium]
MTLTQNKRIRHAGATIASAILLAALAAGCGKATTGESTADRVKRVEERQKTDMNFHAERTPGKTTPQPAAPTTSAVAAGQPSAAVR